MTDLLVQLIKDISLFGNSVWFIAFFVLGFLVYFLNKKDLTRTFSLLLCMTSYVLATILKGVFRESRPEGFSPIIYVQWDTYAFPSAHVLFYTVLFGYLFILTFRKNYFSKLLKHSMRILALLMVTLVGVSRVVSGAHFVRDAVFGYIIGLAYLAIILAVEKYVEQKQAKGQKA